MACILLRSSAVRVHDSQTNRKMDVTRERISHILYLQGLYLSSVYRAFVYRAFTRLMCTGPLPSFCLQGLYLSFLYSHPLPLFFGNIFLLSFLPTSACKRDMTVLCFQGVHLSTTCRTFN